MNWKDYTAVTAVVFVIVVLGAILLNLPVAQLSDWRPATILLTILALFVFFTISPLFAETSKPESLLTALLGLSALVFSLAGLIINNQTQNYAFKHPSRPSGPTRYTCRIHSGDRRTYCHNHRAHYGIRGSVCYHCRACMAAHPFAQYRIYGIFRRAYRMAPTIKRHHCHVDRSFDRYRPLDDPYIEYPRVTGLHMVWKRRHLTPTEKNPPCAQV